MKKNVSKKIKWIRAAVIAAIPFIIAFNYFNNSADYVVGEVIDSHNGIDVYYNGRIGNVSGRNLAPDGYNIGQKYQCVEFIKRYYYEYLDHKMPDPWGHAKNFFDPSVKDGALNKARGLVQYTNPSKTPPEPDDILVLSGFSYGHVGIVTEVTEDSVEMIEQNSGPDGRTRSVFKLIHTDGLWKIDNSRIDGWLRLVKE